MARANSIISTAINAEANTITFRVKDVGELVLDINKVSADNTIAAMAHGFIQRISDAAAMSRNTEDGQPASPADKFEAMRRLVDHYNSGSTDWALRVAKGDGTGAEGSLILRALAAVQQVDVATMRERVTRNAEKRGITTRAYLNAAARHADVTKKMAELRGPAAVDADDMLAELGE